MQQKARFGFLFLMCLDSAAGSKALAQSSSVFTVRLEGPR